MDHDTDSEVAACRSARSEPEVSNPKENTEDGREECQARGLKQRRGGRRLF